MEKLSQKYPPKITKKYKEDRLYIHKKLNFYILNKRAQALLLTAVIINGALILMFKYSEATPSEFGIFYVLMFLEMLVNTFLVVNAIVLFKKYKEIDNLTINSVKSSSKDDDSNEDDNDGSDLFS